MPPMDQPVTEGNSRFERLTMPHRNAAFNLAYWILRDREEAEDVVQDAYLRAFRAFSAFKGEAVKPWLLVIVRNAAYSALQARKRTGRLILLTDDLENRRDGGAREATGESPSPEALVIAESDRKQLLAALAQLSLKYRDILVLREMEGLSYAEIAEVTGIPMGTVMSRLSRGRAELRNALMQDMARHETDAV
jgi:RNA polymerase sigma-70 factor (ECF subfamily)